MLSSQGVDALAPLKPLLIDLEAQKWVTGRKGDASVNDLAERGRKTMRKSDLRYNRRSRRGRMKCLPANVLLVIKVTVWVRVVGKLYVMERKSLHPRDL